MNITINNGNKDTAKIAVSNTLVTTLNERYPEMAMMLAMEELSELSQAISKCVRNGSKDKKDNLAEEIVDVLIVIQWMINRFDIPLQDIQKWAKEKEDRLNDRYCSDEVIFRSKEAKDAYEDTRITPNGLYISRVNKDGQYVLKGDIDNLAEYYHVILTSLREKNKDDPDLQKDSKSNELHDLLSIFEDSFTHNMFDSLFGDTTIGETDNDTPKDTKSKKKKMTNKQEKKNSKDLDKILEKASKKVKKDDKKDSKKRKKDKK